MTPETRARLVRLLGMCGSSHDGERASAAALADRLVRDAGLVWEQVVAAAVPAIGPAIVDAHGDLGPRERDLHDLELLETGWHSLSARERHWVSAFLVYLETHHALTGRQRELLDSLVANMKRRGRAA